MPDLAMCRSMTCTVRGFCYRSPSSGTKPNGDRQEWGLFAPEGPDCFGYEPRPALEPRPTGPAA